MPDEPGRQCLPVPGAPAWSARRPRTAARGSSAVVAFLALVLAGCSAPDDPWEDMRAAVRQVSMTLAGAAMTVETLQRLPPTAPTADVALTDDAEQVGAAEERILLLNLRPGDEATRRDALRLVREAEAALAEARARAAAAEPGTPVPTGELRDLADRLLELADAMAAER